MSSNWEIPQKTLKYRSVDETGHEMWEVDQILAKKFKGGKTLYKVLWEGFTADDCTWEPLENLETVLQLVEDFEENYGKNQNNAPRKLKKTRTLSDRSTKISKNTPDMTSFADENSKISTEEDTEDKIPAKSKLKKNKKSKLLDDPKDESKESNPQASKSVHKNNKYDFKKWKKSSKTKVHESSQRLNLLLDQGIVGASSELDLEFKIAKKDGAESALTRKSSTPTNVGGAISLEKIQSYQQDEVPLVLQKPSNQEPQSTKQISQMNNRTLSPRSLEQNSAIFQQQHQLQPEKASLPQQLSKPKPKPVDISMLGKNEPLKMKVKSCYESNDKSRAFCTISYDPRKKGDESFFFLRDKKNEVVVVDNRQHRFKLTEVVQHTAENLENIPCETSALNQLVFSETLEQKIHQNYDLPSFPFIQIPDSIFPTQMKAFSASPREKMTTECPKEIERKAQEMTVTFEGKRTTEVYKSMTKESKDAVKYHIKEPPLIIFKPPQQSENKPVTAIQNKPATAPQNKPSLLNSMLGMIKFHPKPSVPENNVQQKPQAQVIEDDEPLENSRTHSTVSKERSKLLSEDSEKIQPNKPRRSVDSAILVHKNYMDIEKPPPPRHDSAKKVVAANIILYPNKGVKINKPPPPLGMPQSSTTKPVRPHSERNISLEQNLQLSASLRPTILQEVKTDDTKKAPKDKEILSDKNGETEKEAKNTLNLTEPKQNIIHKSLLELKGLSAESASELISSNLFDEDLLRCLCVKGRIGRDKPLRIVALNLDPERERNRDKMIFKVYWLPGKDLIQQAPSLVPYHVLLRYHPDLLAESLFDQR